MRKPRPSEAEMVPIWKYCERHGIKRQTVYRWIREGKIPAEHLQTVEVVVRRKRINLNFEPAERRAIS